MQVDQEMLFEIILAANYLDIKALLDVGTRLFTVSSSGPDYDLGLLREWVSWRDEVNAK